MIFFLNYDGTLARQDVGRVFQGSTAVPEIKVLSGVSSATSVLQVAFTLPNGLTTQYFPLTNIGEYENNGVKAFLWSLELATDILSNVTEQVGTVGVSVRQINAVSGSVVASYTATFDVEYSALPVPATEYTPADTDALIALLSAYYNQNVTLIDSIQGDYESVVARVTENEGDIATLETDVDRLEELTDKPLLVDITTDLETGIGTKTYNDGTSVTFEVGKDVTIASRGNFMTEVLFAAESQNWAEDGGTYTLTFSPETLERTNDKCIVAVDKLDGNGYKQTANGVFKGSDGTLMLYGVATPFDGKLLVLAGSGAGTKIWSNALQQGSALTGLSFDTSTAPDIYNNFLINGGNRNLIVAGTTELVFDTETLQTTTTINCGLQAQNLDDPPQAELSWTPHKYNRVVYRSETDIEADGVPITGEEFGGLLLGQVVYRENRNTQYYPNNPTGWLVDSLTFDTPVVVEAVNGQDKWGDYITATTKDDLYNVAVVGDYYLDIYTGEWFLCTSKENGELTWSPLFSSKVNMTLNGTATATPDFYAPITTRAKNSNDQVYVLTPQGDNIAPNWEKVTLETSNNLTYVLKVGGYSVGGFTLTKEIFLDSVTYNPETKKLTFTYNTESGKASVDVDLSDLEEVSNALIATNENEFNAYLTEGNIGKTISYNGGLYIIAEGGGSNAPIEVGDTIDTLYFDTSVEPDLSSLNYYETSQDGQAWFMTDNDGNFIIGVVDLSLQPDTASMEGRLILDFEENILYADRDMTDTFGVGEGWNMAVIGEDGSHTLPASRTVATLNQQDLWSSYISKEPFGGGGGITAHLVNLITSITSDGTAMTFEIANGTSIVVPIDYVEAELLNELSYNDLTDKPIVNADLDTITPTANTYYKHTGTTSTYTNGVIYFYNGTEFAEVGGGSGGGVTDVQVNGTSVVADGVANIPPAGYYANGVVTTGAQTFAGEKTFWVYPRALGFSVHPDTSFSNYGGVIKAQNYGLNFGSLRGSNNAYFMFAGNDSGSNSNGLIYLYPGTGYIKHSLPSSSLVSTYLPEHNGRLLSAPFVFSTGTSGGITLASAGLYEVKFSTGAYTITGTVNWDGSTVCVSSSTSIPSTTESSVTDHWNFHIGSTGTLSVFKCNNTGDYVVDTSLTISYRKIGIA